jgi:hypothetical protein
MIGFIDAFFHNHSFNHNQLQQLTINDCQRLAPFLLVYYCLLFQSSFYCDWFGSDLRMNYDWIVMYDWITNDSSCTTECVLSFSLSLTTDGQSVSRSVSLGIKHPSTAYDQMFISVSYLRVCWCGELSFWWEDGSVVYNCWRSPVESFSGPSPVGLAIIFYCLRFETSFMSPPATLRVTVEVFVTASTLDLWMCSYLKGRLYSLAVPMENIVACSFTWKPLLNVRLQRNFIECSFTQKRVLCRVCL